MAPGLAPLAMTAEAIGLFWRVASGSEPTLPRKTSPTGRQSQRSSPWNRSKPLCGGASFSERGRKISPSRRLCTGNPTQSACGEPRGSAPFDVDQAGLRHKYPRHSKALRPSLPPASLIRGPAMTKKPKTKARKVLDKPEVLGWNTSDDDEISVRQWRGRTEIAHIEALEPNFGPYGLFRVGSGSGRDYEVEIRDLTGRANSCGCIDHRVNGLGTCKHIEGVLSALKTSMGETRLRRRRRDRLAACGSVFAARRGGEAKARRRGAHR